MRGWYRMPCWNGLSQYQQQLLIEHGGLSIGFKEMGECENGAEVAVETQEDAAPGPRFYCRPCAIKYLAGTTVDSMIDSAMAILGDLDKASDGDRFKK